MRIDTDKLKVLANDIDDYISAHQKKLIQMVEKNGHQMHSFTDMTGYNGFNGDYALEAQAYCSKCGFEIWLQHDHSNGENHVYLTGDNIDQKCSGI